MELRRRTLMALWLAVALAAGAMVGGTFGSFSATTQNAVNTFQAAGCFTGTQTVNPDFDSWTQSNSPNTNNGGSVTLQVRPNNANKRRALLHFPLPVIPAGCVLTGATLRLNANPATLGRNINVFRAGASWTENGVTWNNQPGPAGTAASTASALGWQTWNVLNHVKGLYQGSNYGLVLMDAAEGSGNALQQYTSSEAATNRPELVVTVATGSAGDTTAPVAMDLQASDHAGGIAGRPELSDTVVLTFSEAMAPGSILAGWTGASANVVVRINNTGTTDDTVEVWNGANTTQLNLGTMHSQGNYVTANTTFGASGTPSTIVMSGVSITVTLGTMAGTNRTDGAINIWTWNPSTAATDVVGNACEASVGTEGGTQDLDF
jgi:hypothetical protein